MIVTPDLSTDNRKFVASALNPKALIEGMSAS